MKILNNIFLGKKILIYGLGKSGISSYKFLKNKSDVYLFDDNKKIKFKIKKKIIRFEQIQKINFRPKNQRKRSKTIRRNTHRNEGSFLY